MKLSVTIDIPDAELAALVNEAIEQRLAVLTNERPMDSAAAAEYLGVKRRTMDDIRSKLRQRGVEFGHQERPNCKLWFTRAELDAYTRGELRVGPSNEG